MNKKILTASLSILLISWTQAADLQTVKKNGYIRIGISGSKPPLGVVVADGDSRGFEAEIARNIAKDLFNNPENLEDRIFFEPVESVDRIPYLKNDKVDLVLANFTNTKERAKSVDFAEPYIKNQIGVVSAKSTPIMNLAQLKGKTLAVVKGTTAEHYFETHLPEVKLMRFAKNSDAFTQFGQGKADALAQDNTLLFPWVQKHQNFVIRIPGIGDVSFISPAVKKGNTELLTFINNEIRKMRTDGRLEAAYNATLRDAFGKNTDKKTFLIINSK